MRVRSVVGCCVTLLVVGVAADQARDDRGRPEISARVSTSDAPRRVAVITQAPQFKPKLVARRRADPANPCDEAGLHASGGVLLWAEYDRECLRGPRLYSLAGTVVRRLRTDREALEDLTGAGTTTAGADVALIRRCTTAPRTGLPPSVRPRTGCQIIEQEVRTNRRVRVPGTRTGLRCTPSAKLTSAGILLSVYTDGDTGRACPERGLFLVQDGRRTPLTFLRGQRVLDASGELIVVPRTESGLAVWHADGRLLRTVTLDTAQIDDAAVARDGVWFVAHDDDYVSRIFHAPATASAPVSVGPAICDVSAIAASGDSVYFTSAYPATATHFRFLRVDRARLPSAAVRRDRIAWPTAPGKHCWG